MPNRRRFIDKKKSITFQLVHRSQHDPLIVDENIGERVLVPLGVEKRKTEQKKYGIYFDDDYDYLQHLRDPCAPPENYSTEVNQKEEEEEEEERDEDDDQYEDEEDEQDERQEQLSKTNELMDRFQLPSTVFESRTTNEIGMLNLAAPDSDPKIHWDPEVIAALDDDQFDYGDQGNVLDDDFMLKANGIEPLDDEECAEFDDEMGDECPSNSVQHIFVPKNNKPIPLSLQKFLEIDQDDDEIRSSSSGSADDDRDRQTSKTKFTNYSMTSSVIRRNEGLQNIDDDFDKIFDEYDDELIGPLDSHQTNPDGIEIDEQLIERATQQLEEHQIKNDEATKQIAIEKTRLMAKRLASQQDETTTIFVGDNENNDDKWDCETILTTYSNIYNHPKLITILPKGRIRLSNKTGLPLENNEKNPPKGPTTDTKQEEEDDVEEVEEEDESSTSRTKISFERKKGETSEERRARKQAVKEFRRDRRSIKKATKLAFKQEEKKQTLDQALRVTQNHMQSLRVT